MAKSETVGYGWDQKMDIPLFQKLKSDLKMAMLNNDTTNRDAIRQIMAEYPKLTIPLILESGKKSTRLKKPDEITDEEVLDIIRSLAKSEKTVLEFKRESSSPYLAILSTYLPRLAGEKEITEWIGANIDFSTFKNPMQAMGPVMKHFGKLADGSLVRKILLKSGE